MEQHKGRMLMSINELAATTNLHRQTIAKRLSHLEPEKGSHSRLKIYDVCEALAAIYHPQNNSSPGDAAKKESAVRGACCYPENERIRIEESLKKLVTKIAEARAVIEEIQQRLTELSKDQPE
ncbi:MAG: DUF1441 family protein [Mixta calida]|uniref:DUF1441 family protein n=1 Tax=Mixta calida TaxID=665913 RepID=UPI002909E51F|nr:DUF1441 family protein [Mixta calida]MDU4940382.1 DUF1441 family protein [Mixta calida]MDU6538459.1 DUF1441 family protein [Mixta calida]